MASLVGSVIVSMVIDDMLKNDGGEEATRLMWGGYKRKQTVKKSTMMGSALARVAARQAIKQGGRALTRRLGKQALKKLALQGVKAAAKGGTIAAAGYAADAGLKKLNGGRKRKRKLNTKLNSRRKRNLAGGGKGKSKKRTRKEKYNF